MLIDVHAHFYTERSPRADWREVNRRRIEAGARIGITTHVASILGTWGARSPTYFPSRDDVEYANEALLEIMREYPGVVAGYCVVNPNFPEHAREQLERRIDAGMIGVKLAASRRADDALLDPIAVIAAARHCPILHHVWQHRRRDWPGQDASDAVELASLARRHPDATFILAHIGGGGEWSHSLRALRGQDNVVVDLSGSGIDTGMLEQTIDEVGAQRIVWGTDLTMDTGWAKLRYLASLRLTESELASITYRNAQTLFPAGAFDDR
ncbi:MAG TPA: amidohydrolase family protein [Gemmatimonadales bacterium]